MKGLILAAGQGTRLRPLTDSVPKCMVEIGGHPMLDYQLHAFRRSGITHITIVTGYQAGKITSPELRTVHNPNFATTNMVASMMCAEHLFTGNDDIVVSYSDIVYDPEIISNLMKSDFAIAVVIDRQWRALWQLRMADPLDDAESLMLSARGNITSIGRKTRSYDDIEGQYVGLIKVKASFATQIRQAYRDLCAPDSSYDPRTMYMTDFLQYLIDRGEAVYPLFTERGWLEIDSLTDLKAYNSLIENNSIASFCKIIGNL